MLAFYLKDKVNRKKGEGSVNGVEKDKLIVSPSKLTVTSYGTRETYILLLMAMLLLVWLRTMVNEDSRIRSPYERGK